MGIQTQTTKDQKQQVNDTHCCACFKLRTAILLSICTSIILIVSYGYKYWMNPSSRLNNPEKFYGYLVVAGLEVLLCIIGWIGIYNHIRVITKYFTYWIIIHILIIIMVFWVSTLFDYLHFGFFIAWTVVQILLLFLLWRFKQILKMIYGWDDTEDSEQQSEPSQEAPRTPISLGNDVNKDNNQNKSNVNVTVNLTMPHQQQQRNLYQAPMQPMPMGYNPMMPQQMYNQYPPMQPLPDPPVVSPKMIQQNPVNTYANVEEKAPPKKDNVRISVYENEQQHGNVVKAEDVPNDPITSQFSYSNDIEHEQMYQSRRRRTNEDKYEAGEGVEDDLVIHSDSTRDLMATNAYVNNKQFDEQRPRVKTPDPPPPPNISIIDEAHAIGSDEDVLSDDFIADVKPDLQRSDTPQGVNLYFLDSGNEVTGGYNEKQ